MDKIKMPEDEEILKFLNDLADYCIPMDGGKMRMKSQVWSIVKARDAAIRAECAPKWISVKERLPEAERTVFVRVFPESQYMKPYTTNACYIPPKTVLAENFLDENSDGLADEYDESNDCYWVKEGWFEICMEGEYNYKINGTITHWMPLPEPPKADV